MCLAAKLVQPVCAELREKYPTPIDVIDTLTEPADHFECDIEDAKRMLRDWPNLVQPEAQEQAAAAEAGA